MVLGGEVLSALYHPSDQFHVLWVNVPCSMHATHLGYQITHYTYWEIKGKYFSISQCIFTIKGTNEEVSMN